MNDNHVAREYVTEFECTFDNLKTIISDGTDEECAELYESFSGFFDRLAEALGPVRAWLDSPPQNRKEGPALRAVRAVLFGLPPFSWFFEREVFAVGEKRVAYP